MKYYVHLEVTVSRLVLIEADCEEDAATLAEEGKGKIEGENEINIIVEFVEDGE